jgi:SAM-dependent methyltransferase
MGSIREDFGKFVRQGNLVQLAIAFVMGAAFSALVAALVADIITPLIGVAGKFDAVLFSYTLSMIPTWERALDRAAQLLKPAGLLAVVDFSEQTRLPTWFRALLRRWLALFDVTPRARLLSYLREIAAREGGAVSAEPLYRDYACLIHYRR